MYPGVVEAVVGPLHAAEVDGEAASENVAGMGGCVPSEGDFCVFPNEWDTETIK